MVSLKGLDNISSVEGNVEISNNSLLNNLSGPGNLKDIGGYLLISNNAELQNLTGIDFISPNSVGQLQIIGNNSLTHCTTQSICEYLASPDILE
jgi:hypothetical protein